MLTSDWEHSGRVLRKRSVSTTVCLLHLRAHASRAAASRYREDRRLSSLYIYRHRSGDRLLCTSL